MAFGSASLLQQGKSSLFLIVGIELFLKFLTYSGKTKKTEQFIDIVCSHNGFLTFPLVSDLRKTGDYLIALIGFSLFDLHCISLNWSLFSNASTPKGNSVLARDCLIKSY